MLYKTIFINLARNLERRDFMLKQLKELDIPFERFEAVNGVEYVKSLTGGGNEYDEALLSKLNRPKMTPGEIGCALSHKRIYQKFLNDPLYKDTKYLLILEDDAELPKNFKLILDTVCANNEKNKKFNMLQFYSYPSSLRATIKAFYPGRANMRFKGRVGVVNFLKKCIFIISIPTIRGLWYLHWKYIKSKAKHVRHQLFNKGLGGSHAYIIDKKAAQVFLDNAKNIISLADWIFGEKDCRKRIRFYSYYPSVVKIGGFDSAIDSLDKTVKARRII